MSKCTKMSVPSRQRRCGEFTDYFELAFFFPQEVYIKSRNDYLQTILTCSRESNKKKKIAAKRRTHTHPNNEKVPSDMATHTQTHIHTNTTDTHNFMS